VGLWYIFSRFGILRHEKAGNPDRIAAPPQPSDKVFETAPQPAQDISTIISIRLNAMKRLSSNPNDPVLHPGFGLIYCALVDVVICKKSWLKFFFKIVIN
jgi:hypothetical protein